MSMNEKEKLWMAYLDGEMTASEASAFDERLSPAERDRLAVEARIESGLAQTLGQEVKCPDAVWRQLKVQMDNEAPARPSRISWGRFALLAASLLVVSVAGYWYVRGHDAGTGLQAGIHGPTPADPEMFALLAKTGPDADAIEGYMRDHDIQLALAESVRDARAQMGGHEITLVGSCEGKCPHGSIVEVMFLCDNEPARVLVTKVGSPGAHMITEGLARGELRSTKRVGEYMVGLICAQDATGLLDLLEEAPQQVT